ncbi:MAG: putative acetyltransferase [Myxococcaceae bacterium]|nr:putative acetyltransferase [Myxococcaceae bacterium]
MTATVSEITSADRPALAALLSGIEQFKPDEVEVALELIDASLRDPGGSGYECLVAHEGGRVVGYLCIGPTPMTEATWDLYWIAVDPKLQGRGVGRALYAAFVTRIVARGGRQVRIETSSKESYGATGGFYERLGFTVDGRLRDFYAPGDDLLIFYRQLD